MNASTERLLWMAEKGDSDAFGQLLETHRGRLERLVALRLDLRLRARFAPGEVAQAILVEGLHRRGDYFRGGRPPIYVWLREIALGRLGDLHHSHLPFVPGLLEDALAKGVDWQQILSVRVPDIDPRNLSHLNHRQRQRRVSAALAELRTPDREILAMRHLDQLSTRELSALLNVTSLAAIGRYRRALSRLYIIARRMLLAEPASESAY